MSTVSYKKVFTIKIAHDYFSNSVDKSISLSPGLITKELSTQFDIQIHIMQNMYNVFINSESSTEEFLNYIENTTSKNYFDFNIQVSDPNFYSYTNIPIDSNTSYQYESNASENSLENNTLLLKSKVQAARLNDTFAEVKIYFQDIIENPSEEYMFLITFKSRATFWQYFIINKSQINLSNPFIEGNIEIDFEDAKQVTIENGDQAIVFTTKQPLKLSAFPKYQFDLFHITSKNGLTRAKKVFVGLPNPNPSNISIINKDGMEKLFSPMYIYV